MDHRHITIEYELYYPDSREPYASGVVNSRGVNMEPDHGMTSVELALEFLRKSKAQGGDFDGFDIYKSIRLVDEGTELGNGYIVEDDSVLHYIYFLENFSQEEEKEIYRKLDSGSTGNDESAHFRSEY